MNLFSASQRAQIDLVAKKSAQLIETKKSTKSNRSINSELNQISEMVQNYFKDSEAVLITTVEELHEYVDNVIKAGYAGIDTETTGLDRIHDYIVGASLYYPGGTECYIPMKHLVPIFDVPAKNQLTYEEVQSEFQRIADNNVRLIFANADFDLAMIYKDIHVDFNLCAYFDVLLAWRCLKEDEKDNSLKGLYNKYVLKGKGDPKKFTDFFSPALFPYCKTEIAKLYAANDAKITYELFLYELPYLTETSIKCQRCNLEEISRLVWKVEFPMIKICQDMHRVGIYLDKETTKKLKVKYTNIYNQELDKMAEIVQEILDTHPKRFKSFGNRPPFTTGREFNPNSTTHVLYLLKDVMDLPQYRSNKLGTGKEVLTEINLPVTKQILKVRGAQKLLSTYIDKLPRVVTPDNRVHARFNSIGADTGRMSSADPNLQNIPSHATDIRHMFRASAMRSEIMECQPSDNLLSIVLPNYYILNTEKGEKSVHSLEIGDKVTLLRNSSSYVTRVEKIEQISNRDYQIWFGTPSDADSL